MQNFIIRITQENINILNDSKIGCFILPDTVSETFAKKFISQARQQGKLVLVIGNNVLCFYQKFNPDGFILNTVQEQNPRKFIENVKAKYPTALLGVISRNRRHEAMLVSEAEPDFIIFKCWKEGLEQSAELLQWYSELFLIQCAAQIEENIDFSSLLCDFVIISDKEYLSKK